MLFDVFSSCQIRYYEHQRVISVSITDRCTTNKLVAPFIIHRGALLMFKFFNIPAVKLRILPPFTLEIFIKITATKKRCIVYVLVMVQAGFVE